MSNANNNCFETSSFIIFAILAGIDILILIQNEIPFGIAWVFSFLLVGIVGAIVSNVFASVFCR